MLRDEAIRFQKGIEDLCEKNDAFCFTTYEKKPDLKLIRLEISIKVDTKKGDK